MLTGMNVDGAVLDRLSGGQCLRLMTSVPIGRIVYTLRALPAIEPVCFALDGRDIVFRTDPDGPLAAAIRQAVVAFEVDELGYPNRDGWSVTVVGIACEVTDPAEATRLREIGLTAWAPGEREHFIRIVPGIITGRRLRRASHLGDQAM
jgi:hypothetical protein